MSQLLQSRPVAPATRPRALRRLAVGVTGFLTCFLPAVWTVNLTRMLVTGELSEHRFHQLTGQGLLLTVTWLTALLPLVVAGWRGRRPATAPSLLHLGFVGAGLGCAIAAPQGGALALGIVIAVTGGLLWLALPVRPSLGHIDLAPVGLAAALLLSATVAPYAVEQIGLQHQATGHHAQNPHLFDMAWLVVTFAVAGLAGALVHQARPLLLLAGGGAAATGAAMLVLDQGAVRGLLFVVAGLIVLASWTTTRRMSSNTGQRTTA